MAGITAEQAQEILDALIAAQLAGTGGGQSSVEVLGKKVSFQDPTKLQQSIDYWDRKCQELEIKGTRTGRRIRGGTPT